MNMTVVLISKRSVEMLVLVLCLLSLVALNVVAPFTGASHLEEDMPNKEELPDSARAILDDDKPLSDEMLKSIVKEYSESVKHTMDSEMERLIGELEGEASSPGGTANDSQEDEEHLNRLKRANEQASDEIKTRIGLASDTSGALPQWSPGQAAADLVSAASSRLQAAGSFTGDKLRSLTSRVSKKIPARLRRFFRWPSFASFKAKFNKNYSTREELYRQMIYLRNQVVVGIQRVRFLFRRDKHITKATQFADWTKEEYHDVHNNPEAETQADAAQFGHLDAAAKAKLQQVASSGKNAFGQPLVLAKKATDGSSSNKRKVSEFSGDEQKRQRNKRNANEDDDDEDEYDELGDSEEEDLDIMLEEEGMEDAPMTSEEEFKLLEQFSNAKLTDEELTEVTDMADEALALNSDFKRIDLRDTGCISESENQDNCGNCYSQVIVGAASYYRCMASEDKSQMRFHSRFVSDCGHYLPLESGKQAQIKACRGGRMSHAFLFAKTLGMQRYGEYQIARMGTDWKKDDCAYAKPSDILNPGWKLIPIQQFRESTYTTLTLGEVDLHLRSVGPVFCNIRTWAGFKDFGGGIYDGLQDDETRTEIHSVLIVGHDMDSKGRDYYIVKNSHGVNWGEDGFFRIYNESLSYFGVFYLGLAPQSVE